MSKINIIKKILESYAINIPYVEEIGSINDKISICKDMIDYIELDDILRSFYLSEDSKNITYDKRVEIIVNAIMLENSKKIKILKEKINRSIAKDYYELSENLMSKSNKIPRKCVDKGKIANILLHKLSISDIKRLGLEDIDYMKLNNFLTSLDNSTYLKEENYINKIIKRLYKCQYQLLKEFELNNLLYEPSLKNSLIVPSKNTTNNIYIFILNNKDKIFSEQVMKSLGNKIDGHQIKIDEITEDYYKKYVLLPNEMFDKKYSNAQLFSNILNKYILLSSLYNNYSVDKLDRFARVQEIVERILKYKVIDYISSKNNKITEEEKIRLFKEANLFDIIFSNEKLCNDIKNEEIEFFKQLFDVEGCFKNLTELELAEFIIDSFVIKGNNITKPIKYEDADKIIKKIIENRKNR